MSKDRDVLIALSHKLDIGKNMKILYVTKDHPYNFGRTRNSIWRGCYFQ